MDDLLSLSPPPDPRDREALDKWLTAAEIELSDLLARKLTKIVRDSYQEFLDTLPPQDALTAAGDFTPFDMILPRWQVVVDDELTPYLEQVYLNGSISAYSQANGSKRLTAAEAQSWSNVVNDQAAQYVTGSRNRLRNVGNTVYDMITSKTQAAIDSGASNEELKRSIREIGGFSEFRADVIARTEVVGAYGNGDWNGMQALGQYGPLEKTWLATRDARTRKSHLAMNDKTIPMADAFTVGTKGAQMLYPHDPSGPASETVQCRCIALYLFEGDERPDGSIVQAKAMQEAPPVQTPASMNPLGTSSEKLRAGKEIAESQGSKVDHFMPRTDRDVIKTRHKQTVEKMAKQVKGYRSDDGVNFARTAMQADEVFVASVDDDIAGAIGVNRFSASKLGTPEDAFFVEHLGSMRIVDGVGSQLFDQVVKRSSDEGLGILLSPSDDLAFAWWESVGAQVDPYGIGSPDLGLTSQQVKDLAAQL